jgi:hypothetical protein
MKSFTNCENTSSNPLQRACSSFPGAACDSKSCPKAACDFENCSESWLRMYSGEIQLMRVNEGRSRYLLLLAEQSLELVSVSKKHAETSIVFFCLTVKAKSLKNHLCMFRKYCFELIGLQKQYLSGDPTPLTLHILTHLYRF